MAKKVIKHASFWYTGADGLHQTALRGDEVDITDAADLKRGERHGAFASAEDLKEGAPLAAYIASRETPTPATPAEPDAAPEPDSDPEPVNPEQPVEPAVPANRRSGRKQGS